MQLRRSITLGQLFVAAAAFSLSVIAIGGAFFWRSSERAALDSSERSRQAVARAVEGRVATELGAAVQVLDAVDRGLASGLVTRDDRAALEALLYTELLGAPRLAEVTFTAARPLAAAPGALAPDDDDAEQPSLEPEGRFQVSVFWTAQGQLATTFTAAAGGGFVERRWEREPHRPELSRSGPARSSPAVDPTSALTFLASAALAQAGRPVWSDLHFSELDHGVPEPRVVLSVQKAVSVLGVFGVVRVGLLATALDAITERAADAEDGRGPHRVALLAVPAAGEGAARLVPRV